MKSQDYPEAIPIELKVYPVSYDRHYPEMPQTLPDFHGSRSSLQLQLPSFVLIQCEFFQGIFEPKREHNRRHPSWPDYLSKEFQNVGKFVVLRKRSLVPRNPGSR
ncbi:hypothetical protein BOX24_09580 [Leptospirillum ferriphilum]|uniref:Uncharacterized protein n=1 Tax=Leptospirillum ferriphilum TaxID=178606 RepID=A0A1V3STG8_9BACT|nr:hypothetical protein BOX24_09580 [Leptospirillum ferriphilum]